MELKHQHFINIQQREQSCGLDLELRMLEWSYYVRHVHILLKSMGVGTRERVEKGDRGEGPWVAGR